MAIDEGPPSQYVPATGTSYCLLQSDYDKSLYGQCNYIGNRTLIRCGQIRRKEDLAKNSGICDQHAALRSAIKERYERDMIVLKDNCPPKSPRSRRFTRSLKSSAVVVDEDPPLLPNSQWASESVDNVCRNSTAEHYPSAMTCIMSDKEYARMRIILLKEEIECLKVEKQRIEAEMAAGPDKKRRKRMHDCVSVVNVEGSDGEPVKPKKICLHGHADEDIIKLAVDDLVRSVSGEGSQLAESLSGCSKAVLYGFDYCIRHVQHDSKRAMFLKCRDCDSLVLEEVPEGTDGLCPVHKHVKSRPMRKELAEVGKDVEDDMFSDGENYVDADAKAKKARRPAQRTQIQFTTIPPLSVGQRRPSTQLPPGPHLEAARCRPFHKDFFPMKSQNRTTLPFGHAPRPNIPTIRAPLGQDLSATRIVTVQRGSAPQFTRNTTIQRIATQDRQRNRMQQEEDMKAAASIADLQEQGVEGDQRPAPPPLTPQYRVIRTAPRGGMTPQFRPGTLPVNLADLPEEVKNQPLGSVLRHALITGTGPSGMQQRPRLPVQTIIRKPETPISSSVLAGVVRNVPLTNPAQRHQIAQVEPLKRHQRAIAPPRRLYQRPRAQTTAVAQPPHRDDAQPKLIPLERTESDPTQPVTAAIPHLDPLPADFVTELVDEGRVPQVTARPAAPMPVQEDKVDIVRKKTRPSLPLPKLPNVLRKPPKLLSSVSSTATSSPPKAMPKTPVKEPEEPESKSESPTKKREKSTPRQGQRRSSRLDKTGEEVKDPLSLLADVSAAVRDPE